MACESSVLAGKNTQCCKKELGQQKFQFSLSVPYQNFFGSLLYELRLLKKIRSKDLTEIVNV
jgi:hypothetical protein